MSNYGTGPGDDEREAKRDDAYWKRQGFDRLTMLLLFVVFPVLFVGMLIVLRWVA